MNVSWTRTEDGLRFVVTDDGVGMHPDKLREIRDVLQDGEAIREGSNFAMKNINSLLKVTYGPEYGLTIDSEPGAGTRVTMLLPVVDAETDKNEHGKNKNHPPYFARERAYN